MRNSISYILFFVTFLLNTSAVHCQSIDYEKPPRQENTYLFRIVNYDRQPVPPEYIKKRILEISDKPTTEWTAQDSLFYAYENVHLEEFEIALSIFSRLNVDTIQERHAQMLYRVAVFQLGRYEMLKEFNEKTIQKNPSQFYSIKNAVLDLNNAYLKFKNKTFIPDSTIIFPILKDEALEEMDPEKLPNKNKLVEIAFVIDSAFRHFSVLHDKKDYILAKAFEEMAGFQKEYFYITNAFFYYSAARHFYIADKGIIQKYNKSNEEMDEFNYIPFSFKNKFGKIIKNRFRMNTDFIEKAIVDSSIVPKFTPPPRKEGQKDYLPWINNSILIMIIIALALMFVLFFMKTKK